MSELRAIPGRKKDEDGCDWCHPNYDCHGKGFNRYNCPRVVGLRFLSQEDSHYDKSNEMVWDIAAVEFRSYEFEVETSPDEDA
jgi:hypothetical protein